jgi:type I restriction enzyme S subunit
MMEAIKNTKAVNDLKMPSEWEIITLKDACIKIQDGNYGGDYPKQDEFFESGIPFLTSKAIGGEGEIIEKKIDFISEEKHNQLKKAQLKLNDVLFTNRGANVGTIGLVDERISHGNIGPQLTLLRANFDKINFLFLKEIMKSYFVQNQVRSQDSGSAMNFFGIGDTSKFKIPLPPLPEQKAIAQVLSTADAAIHTTEKLTAQKVLRKKWLMQQLLTGKKRLKGFDGEWNEHAYEKILKVVKRNFDWDENELYKLISVRRRSGGIFYREALYGHQILVKTLRTANEGDFLFSKMQILHGASALVTKEFDGAKISGSYIAVVPKDKKQLNMEFFQWYSQTPYFYHQTYISSYGVHIEKMTFDFDAFLQLEMKLPPIEEQTAIAQVLQAADKEISLLKAKAEKLREQKKGLMQQLLTGKVRLKINNT